jgi:glyoxylase-like metal-dependent hydrolase (beta-lactamase superfamily II)
MTYPGHVTPGGPAAVHELARLTVSKLSVGPMDNNAYLLRDSATGTQLLIDAAADPDRLLALVEPEGLSAVVTTHRHADHWQALADVVAATGCRTMAGVIDAPEIPVPTSDPLSDGDIIEIGDSTLEVIQLRGHTPGAIAVYYDDPFGHGHLFVGDCLFPGGVGRTWSPADFDLLLGDVTSRLFDRFSDETWVYPGHGDDTTLGAERPQLAEWGARGW